MILLIFSFPYQIFYFVGCHLSWYNLGQHPEVNSWFGKIKSRDIPRLSALKVELSPLIPLTTPYLFWKKKKEEEKEEEK